MACVEISVSEQIGRNITEYVMKLVYSNSLHDMLSKEKRDREMRVVTPTIPITVTWCPLGTYIVFWNHQQTGVII